MASEDEIKHQLKTLLIQKRNGELDTEEKLLHSRERDVWRDSVPYDVLKCYIHHHDEEIRLNTLALLVESKKSTLNFISKELELIIMFLDFNLRERLEFVPLIKAALKRMKDSLFVMRRQLIQEKKMRDHYEENYKASEIHTEAIVASHEISKRLNCDIDMYCLTFVNIRNICMCSPDATYHRRKSSLQILLLLRDFLDNEFKEITWSCEQAEKVFTLLILDTYESNKEMAFKLLKSLDVNLLQLDKKDRVWDIVRVGIELGNSIRPIDTITAAYLLKVSMLSPIIQDVLQTRFCLNEYISNMMEAATLQFVLVLLKKLEESLVVAKENIVMAVTKHSLYGYLFCLRSLLTACNLRQVANENLWQDTIARLLSVCLELNGAVSLIVNNSSPEGHLPMDLNSQAINKICNLPTEKEMVTPQMILLCSWRTVKEVSLLFGLLATKSPICEDATSVVLLQEKQIIKIGEHLVNLLTETKHRGAFEQAHVGFSQLCTRLWRLNNETLKRLPQIWLHQILIAITGFTQDNLKLCATRRSAGVPFMVQALLSSEPRPHKDAQTTTFYSVMKILLGFTELESGINLWVRVKQLMYEDTVFAEYENRPESLTCINGHCIEGNENQITEIKTHSLNVLRAIFRHSQLGEVVNNYVANGLMAAFKSYDGLTWAERNAATLLFSALIIRIFGVQRTKDHINLTTDNKMNCRLFFERYPSLLPFILRELQTFVSINDTVIKTNVQAILLLLSRLYLTHNSDESPVESKINEIVSLISQCAKSSVYETRILAARALVPLLTEKSVKNVTQGILNNLTFPHKEVSLNLTHGYMLQILEIVNQFSFEKLQTLNIDWSTFLRKMKWIIENLEYTNHRPACFPLATVYVNICHQICKDDHKMILCFQPVLLKLASHLLKKEKLKQGPAREIYKTSVIELILLVLRNTGCQTGTSVLPENFLVEFYMQILNMPEVQIIAWTTLTEITNIITHDTETVLGTYAVELVYKLSKDIYKCSPELQDAIFNFLYNCLVQFNENIFQSKERKTKICKFVLNELRVDSKKNSYCERDTYLRLLGKSYTTLNLLEPAWKQLNQECINEVYTNFCDNFWISSLTATFRASVFSIMLDLFPKLEYCDKYQLDIQIQWWTTILQLLVDNNSNVRHEASLLVDKISIEPFSEERIVLRTFLGKFCGFMQDNYPEIACAVLFYWSISLLEDMEYEMDDTDVFNKCSNYDFFEAVEVSKICVEFLRKYVEHAIDNALSDDTIDWINSRLNVDFPKSISFRKLVKKYRNYVSVLENQLQDILDPLYKNKLLQVLAYENYKSIYDEDA